ncbi:uncharacterized protein LOC129797599 [Lutzomyia longipalpis]|nr:uncharacterized protein LOC129797599 [Lutzomyia longipalpis]
MADETDRSPSGKEKKFKTDGEANVEQDFFKKANKTPEWLNNEYIEKALRQYEYDPNLQITACEIVPATKVGDNFASVIFRANITYVTKGKTVTTTLIMKVADSQKAFMQDVPLFQTEINIYLKVLPEMQRLLNQLGDKDIMFPKMIYHHINPDIIILEDIASKGYVMRHKPMNLENTKKVAERLAKFHALSFYLYHEEKKELDDFKFGLVTTATLDTMNFFADGFMRAVRCAKEWEGFAEIAEKMEKFGPHLMKKIRDVYIVDKSEGAFNVLNHGDFHIKNLLFINGENDDVQKVSFIDFQISVWGTPAIDLMYVLYVIASTEVRDNHADELIMLYHTKFCSILKQLGYLKKPPSLLNLNVELLKNGVLEIILSCQFMAMFYMAFESLTPEQMSDMELLSKKIYNESGMRPILEKLFVKFLHKGYFEV